MAQEDYYQILGVSKESSDDEIKKAYRKLAHQYHPDKKGGDEAKFKKINEAYQVLSDPQKKAQYDQFGQAFNGAGPGGGAGAGGFGGFDFSGFDFGGSRGQQSGFEDIFSEFFSAAGFGGTGPREAVGSDIAVDVTLEFEEMARGATKELNLYKKVTCSECEGTGAKDQKTKTCPTCGGKGRVRKMAQSFFGSFSQVVTCQDCQGKGQIPKDACKKCGGDGVTRDYQKVSVEIPPGIEEGQTLRMSGQGEAPAGAGRAGDLYINIHVKPHEEFSRQGRDIVSTKEISYSQAALGDKVSVNTIEGKVNMKISPGTQPGDIYKIKGRGVVGPTRFGRGHHLVEIKVKVPERLSKDQRSLVEKLQKEGL
jgi:molecular chaperone DnaJ